VPDLLLNRALPLVPEMVFREPRYLDGLPYDTTRDLLDDEDDED